MQDLNNNELITNNAKQQDVDIKFLFAKVFGNWHWYVISVFAFLVIGALIYIFTPPMYNVTGRVLVTGYNPQGKAITGTSEGTVLSELGLFSVPNSVNNELEIIHSRTLIEQTVRDMQLNVTYWGQGDIRYEEIYKNSPYFIQLLWLKNISDPVEYDVRVKGDKVQFNDENTDSSFTASFGDTLRFSYGSWILLKNENVIETNPSHELGMVINSYNQTIYTYMDGIEALTTNEFVNIIDLTISGATPEKNEDILSHLIHLYVRANVEDHNRVADSTIAFIDSRIYGVGQELTNIDRNIEAFKKQNRLTDLNQDASQLLQTSTTVTQSLADKEVQLKVVDDLEKYLTSSGNSTRIMPTTAPIKDPAFVQTLDKYNSLQLQRQTYLQTSTEANPNVKSIDIQLTQLRGDLLSMMRTYKKGITTEQTDLAQRNAQMMGSIEKVPTQQRVYLDFTRRQDVMQGLYLYLLQTREQTAVSKSNNITPIRIIDEPIRAPLPYFPSLVILVAAAIFLGVLIPSVTLFMRELLNTRVISTDDISNYTNVPVVANISHDKTGKAIVVSKEARSEVSEQFRTLRTNLQFLMPDNTEKVILITSSMGGEGKSFVIMNLANAIALSGKKVLLMELDLRDPHIYTAMNMDNSVGFTNYIISDVKANDLIKPTTIHPNFYFIGPGSLPPNPAELLVHDKVQQLFDEVKKEFDYVLVDCSPVGLVTDALLLSKYADIALYTVRQRVTYKKQINLIQGLANDRRFKRINVIFNDIKPIPGYSSNYGKKHTHGYYGTKRRSFFKRIFAIGKRKKTELA